MTLINADDYGITLSQAEHILDCRREGRLTGVSAMPNSPALERAMGLLADDGALTVAVHLNATEGLCLSPPEEVPLLAGPDGRFRQSFFRLFALSLGPKRRALQEQLAREFARQIRRTLPLLGDRPLRLDGHQHIQMIPVVLEAIRDAVRENGWTVTYIRWAREPLLPYLRRPSVWRYSRPVNVVKNLTLNALALRSGRVMDEMGLKRNMVMGLVLSGNMAYEPVHRLLPDMERAAAKKGCTLELVMHPGWGVGPDEELDVPGGRFEAFYLSPGRRAEYDCLRRL